MKVLKLCPLFSRATKVRWEVTTKPPKNTKISLLNDTLKILGRKKYVVPKITSIAGKIKEANDDLKKNLCTLL
jgi:hypothetical protein